MVDNAIPRVGAHASDRIYPDAPAVDIEDILDTEIVILGTATLTGNYGPYIVCLFTYDGGDEEYTFVTGGVVVIRKLAQAVKAVGFPLRARITHEKRFYDIA